MPDVYLKGAPHSPRVTVAGHYLGMHAVEQHEIKPAEVWYRGDDYAEFSRRVVILEDEVRALQARVNAVKPKQSAPKRRGKP
jgi:hypothetical protein